MSDDYNIKDEIESLKATFQPHNLSKSMCHALKEQTDIQESVKELLKKTMENDVNTQKILKVLMKESLGESIWGCWKQIVTLIFAIFLAALGGGYFWK